MKSPMQLLFEKLLADTGYNFTNTGEPDHYDWTETMLAYGIFRVGWYARPTLTSDQASLAHDMFSQYGWPADKEEILADTLRDEGEASAKESEALFNSTIGALASIIDGR